MAQSTLSNSAAPSTAMLQLLHSLPGQPKWTGERFLLRQQPTAVLAFEVGTSGWSEDLTRVHENTVGRDHYIDRASRKHALSQLVRYVQNPAPIIMEVGCSTGYFLQELRSTLPHAQIIGADYVVEPLHRLAKHLPKTPLLQFDLTRCPLPDNSLDAIVLLNVLEHIEDDTRAMAQIHRILKPGGIAVIEVPAGPQLYDVCDKQLQHFRRYTMTQLQSLAETAELSVVTRSHLGFLLYPPFWLTKKRNRRLLHTPEAIQRQIFERTLTASGGGNMLLHRLMDVEATLRSHFYLPFGIRCLMTCKKL